MPEWLYEEGIGENRAILVDADRIVEAAIELPDEPQVGAVLTGRLSDVTPERNRGWVHTSRGPVLVQPLAKGLSMGAEVRVELVREEILEPGQPKASIGRLTDEPEKDGLSLKARIGKHSTVHAHGPDRFAAAGWNDLVEEAVSGDILFEGGELRLSLTPAMTLFDVDGYLPPAELAIAGAAAAAGAIRRHSIGGSIGIDLPTVSGRAERQRAAEALDERLPEPFERTAVNGFGFLQVVRKRERRSIPEIMQYTPIESAARALLRRAERVPGVGARLLIASAAVVRHLESREDWLGELRRRIGTDVKLQAQPGFTNWGYHVQSVQS